MVVCNSTVTVSALSVSDSDLSDDDGRDVTLTNVARGLSSRTLSEFLTEDTDQESHATAAFDFYDVMSLGNAGGEPLPEEAVQVRGEVEGDDIGGKSPQHSRHVKPTNHVTTQENGVQEQPLSSLIRYAHFPMSF